MASVLKWHGAYWIEGTSLRDVYALLCRQVVDNGDLVKPRGMSTRELICPTIVIRDPSDCLPTGVGRGVSLRIAAVEAVQLCGGFSDPELTVRASNQFERYREPDGQFHGAYGTRIGNQLSEVVAKLRRDPGTRQAVVTLWDPHRDNLTGKLDYPCTVSFQFLIRYDELVLVTNMRSNDVWLGLAYDLFQFGQMQWTVANTLGMECGPLVHRPVSLHAYERDWDQIRQLRPPDDEPSRTLYGFTDVYTARMIGRGEVDALRVERSLTYTEQWYVDVLKPLRVGGG